VVSEKGGLVVGPPFDFFSDASQKYVDMNKSPARLAPMTIIPKDSPLYLKRLVRELNSTPDGFYASFAGFCFRSNRARLNKGELQVRSLGSQFDKSWITPSRMNFQDVFGREIIASRVAK